MVVLTNPIHLTGGAVGAWHVCKLNGWEMRRMGRKGSGVFRGVPWTRSMEPPPEGKFVIRGLEASKAHLYENVKGGWFTLGGPIDLPYLAAVRKVIENNRCVTMSYKLQEEYRKIGIDTIVMRRPFYVQPKYRGEKPYNACSITRIIPQKVKPWYLKEDIDVYGDGFRPYIFSMVQRGLNWKGKHENGYEVAKLYRHSIDLTSLNTCPIQNVTCESWNAGAHVVVLKETMGDELDESVATGVNSKEEMLEAIKEYPVSKVEAAFKLLETFHVKWDLHSGKVSAG
jgi:hypothetical protein